MQEVSYSPLLQQLLNDAKGPDAAEDALPTTAAFLATAIETALKTGVPARKEDIAEFTMMLSCFRKRGVFLKETARRLRAWMEENPAPEGDAVFLRGKIFSLASRESEAPKPVTADALVAAILEKLPAHFNSCFRCKSDLLTAGADGEVSQEAVAERRKRLSEMIQEAKGSRKTSDQPQNTDSTEPNGDPASPPANDQMNAVAALIEDVKRKRGEMMRVVRGQDQAVAVFTNGFFQGELTALMNPDRKRPRATFLFAGPPGVGKTFLAETAEAVLKLPCRRFDMSEYSDKEATIPLIGSDGVYKNAQPGALTSFVEKNPKCILLFDEIEKAHINVIHLFLQILDAGALADANTRKTVSFRDAIVIFTTNAGRSLYEDSESRDLSGLSRKVILSALKNDVNPATGEPSFPPAMCSRFGNGNVVMFNHLTAHDLCDIAREVITKQTDDLAKTFGIRTQIDRLIYPALLFAEGGGADARTVRGRAGDFFHGELYELLRLIDTDKTTAEIHSLREIRLTLELPENDPEIRALFEPEEKTAALVFAAPETASWCRANSPLEVFDAQQSDSAMELLREKDIRFVLVDLAFDRPDSAQRYLNIEDIQSGARDYLHTVRETRPDLPVFLLTTAQEAYSMEEQISFRRTGVKGFLAMDAADGTAFTKQMEEINESLHQQTNIDRLARSNRVVTYETGQTVSADGAVAEIRMFDFQMKTAVEGEDQKNVLSSLSRPDVHFDEVIGAEDAKKELQYFVNYLQNPKKYTGTGVSAPKGVLLYGSPGTGKTMLAKAMACEADVTFIAAEGNQFLRPHQGEGPDAVHELFRTARRYAPSILFVDEIDAIAKTRTGDSGSPEEILTAFLTEMDGFKVDPARPVFVLAATNFDVEPGSPTSLDPALMRRFDRRIYVDLPNKEERIRFLKMQFGRKKIFELSDQMIDNIALRSTGMSLAALDSVIELSMRMTIREGSLKVTDAIFEEAFETFNSGDKKEWSADTLERVARHEAGHALLSWLAGDKPTYLTIVARGSHGGYMQHGEEDKQIYTRAELQDRIRISLGGRAAELMYYGEEDGLSTGAGADLVSATGTARRVVCAYGMDPSVGLAVVSPSDANTPEIRDAVNRILSQELDNAVRLLREHREAIDGLVDVLLRVNRMTGQEIDDLLTKLVKR